MNFLIIVAVILLVYQGEWIRHLQKDGWFETAIDRLMPKSSDVSWLPFAVLVGLPTALLAFVLFKLMAYWVFIFLINILVLSYSVGRGNWRKECQSWVELFSEQDPAILREKLSAAELTDQDDLKDEEIEVIWQAARKDVLYHQLSGFYAVTFWFFLLGAPIALFYRLTQMYQLKRGSESGENLPDAQQILWLLEWLPVRLMALLFCLVGHFATSFWVLKQVMRDTFTASAEVLTRCADAALFLDKEVTWADLGDKSSEELEAKRIEKVTELSLEHKTLEVMRGYSMELQGLLQHVEVAFVAALALVTLL